MEDKSQAANFTFQISLIGFLLEKNFFRPALVV